MRHAVVWLVIGVAAGATALPRLHGQADRFDQHRIFLTDGHALPSFGDYAVVGDRIVFTLPVGPAEAPSQLQLMSLPLTSVDIERTERYATTLRAARYAATRGEADYLAVTAEVSRAIDQLREVADPAQRLAMAEEARRRLLDWSREHFSYRAADIQELASLFDEIIGELRVAAGETAFAVDLRAGTAPAATEPLLDGSTFAQSISHALHAATVADVVEERFAILRAARTALDASGDDSALRSAVEASIASEEAASRAYADLARDIQRRADGARTAADIEALDALRRELADRDEALGGRRVAEVRALDTRIAAYADEVRALGLAEERYRVLVAGRVRYELAVRPVTSALDGLRPVLEHIRDKRYMSFRTLDVAQPRAERLPDRLADIPAPDDLADIHATLGSAVFMAREAIARWRRAAVAGRTEFADDASAAASGALLLLGQAREVLLERLRPPRLR